MQSVINLLSNGFLIQYGYKLEGDNYTDLPISYSNNTYILTATCYESYGWAMACVVLKRTLSNFKLIQVNHGGVLCYEQCLWISCGF